MYFFYFKGNDFEFDLLKETANVRSSRIFTRNYTLRSSYKISLNRKK